MEIVKFNIDVLGGDMCRIVPVDYRATLWKIADGGCICSLDVMLSEMEHIKKQCAEIGVDALFEI